MEAYPSRRIRNEVRWRVNRANRVAAERTIRLIPLIFADCIIWIVALSRIAEIM